MVQPKENDNEIAVLAAARFGEQTRQSREQTDRLFLVLMPVQWLAGVALAWWVSPRTWDGLSSRLHPHVWAGVLLGGLFSLLPILLICLRPGSALTRQTVAIGQMLTSALLIHLTGGRIETHFHVFGSLAFLSFYRDPKLILIGSAVVAADHFLRGVFWPESVYGILSAGRWRWLEHAGWVAFEDFFLLAAMVTHTRLVKESALGQARLELANQQLRESDERFRQAQKMEAIGRLAGGVAHDFNNLLTVINGYSEALLKGEQDDSRRRDLEEIYRAGQRAARLTRQLLTFSRRQAVNPKVLDLNGVVKDMEVLLRRLIGEDVRLTTTMEPRLGRIRSDAGHLEQAIMNLAVNARDAMPHGGSLRIETFNAEGDDVRPGPFVGIRVTDTGCGMDSAVLARIFEPFFTTKGVGKGTGLGLSVIYGVVEQNGGRIDVKSAPGKGTTFTLLFPRVMDPLEERGKDTSLIAHRGGAETILLVEDEASVRRLALAVLQQNGYHVIEAANGEDALKTIALEDRPIDLVITDIVMPEVGGPELVRHLMPKHPRLKVIYMSGYSDETLLGEGVLDKNATLFEKPFAVGLLAKKVRDVLDRTRESGVRPAVAVR
jgi:signal transduction histidine kinase